MKKGQEQLNLIQRTQIQTLLKVKSSLTQIALEMGISRQTIYRELLRNSYTESMDTYERHYFCEHYKECLKIDNEYSHRTIIF